MLDIPIIYEDQNTLVLNKPAGISVHADGKRSEYTLGDWLIEKCPEMREVGEPLIVGDKKVLRPGIVHRLDKDTSGVLVVAKSQESYLFFKKQFQDKTIQKKYLALVYGNPKGKEWTVQKPIGRSRGDFRLKATSPFTRGEVREAVTNFKKIKDFEGYSLVEAKPITGRTHQIRVHLKSVGYPVVCDKLYAKNKICLPEYSFQMLHACSIRLRLINGTIIELEASLPNGFQKALDTLRAL